MKQANINFIFSGTDPLVLTQFYLYMSFITDICLTMGTKAKRFADVFIQQPNSNLEIRRIQAMRLGM